MRYDIRNSKGAHWVNTSDGIIRTASEALKWSIGRRIAEAMEWALSRKFKVYVTPEDGGSTRKIDMEQEDAV